MFSKIISAIRKYGNFTDDELSMVTGRLQLLNYERNSNLLKPGQICGGIYFVNSGAFRQYDVTEEGIDNTINLFMDADWMLEYKSFTLQKPSEIFIEATEDSEVFLLTVHALHELINISGAFFKLGSILEVAVQNQRYQNNRITPEEKYALLLKEKPELINRFPAKYIASYLGMAPETLSRVRRKLIS